VHYLSTALIEHFTERSDAGVDTYSQRCLSRVWKASRFSWWFTSLMHRFPNAETSGGPMGYRLQQAELEYLVNSEAAMTTMAENYVGLPF
jgi:p-hydroxybenzoate 3-monooxygenase